MLLKLRSEPRSWKRGALGETKFEPKMKSDPGTWGKPPTTPKVSQGLGRGSSPTFCSNLTVIYIYIYQIICVTFDVVASIFIFSGAIPLNLLGLEEL